MVKKLLAKTQHRQFLLSRQPDKEDSIHVHAKDAVVIVIGVVGGYILEYHERLNDALSLEFARGYIADGETVLASAKREVLEELNISESEIKALSEIGQYDTDNSYIKQRVHVVLLQLASRVVETKLNYSEGVMGMTWLPFPDLKRMIQNGEITDSYTIASSAYLSH